MEQDPEGTDIVLNGIFLIKHMTDTKNENRKDKKKPVYLDYNIFQGKVKLVQENGKTVVIERDSAIDMAKSQGKNLMQVGYNKSEFPHSICKIVDYGKFLYDQKKKEKERAKKAREANAEAKEIYFSIRIDSGDFNTKVAHVKKFLEEGEKVNVCVKLLRREMNLLGMAKDMMYQILSNLNDIAEMDSNPSFSGGIMSCVLRRKKK